MDLLQVEETTSNVVPLNEWMLANGLDVSPDNAKPEIDLLGPKLPNIPDNKVIREFIQAGFFEELEQGLSERKSVRRLLLLTASREENVGSQARMSVLPVEDCTAKVALPDVALVVAFDGHPVIDRFGICE